MQVCEPVPPDSFYNIELFCVLVFTLDYGLRVLAVNSVPARYLSA
jgi:hypothetical protein